MKAGGYLRAASLAEAVSARARGGIIIAGGTDVMVKGRSRNAYADKLLVDVSGIGELHLVGERGGAIEIGAACTLSGLCADRTLRERLPLLVDAMEHVGGVQTRNRATVGGSVVNACPASDIIPALMVLGASVRTTARTIPLADFFVDCPHCLKHEGMHVRSCFFPDAASKKTVLEPGELVRSLIVPLPRAGSRHLFYKLARTQNIGLARINLALIGTLLGGVVEGLSISMGGLFPRPCTLDGCSAILRGTSADVSTLDRVKAALAEKLAAESSALVDYGYKSRVAPALLADGIAAFMMGETLERKRRT